MQGVEKFEHPDTELAMIYTPRVFNSSLNNAVWNIILCHTVITTRTRTWLPHELCHALTVLSLIIWVYQSKRDYFLGACSVYGRNEKCRIIVGKPDGKISLGKPRSRQEDNIKKYCKELV
jgi:hypothetical protein